ncbi:MAG TPA: T9SS type A sorting domain-containing protein, partial [Adhaeribacter sp.]|nr:T9SS type A sorting domain-containing protein [Adhaeribacter sp.]
PGTGNSRTPAVLPTNVFRNRYNHQVVNPYNDTMIAYNAVNAGTFSYGGFEMYYYIVNTAEFNAASGRFITVTAKAGRPWQLQRYGQVVIDVDLCLGVQPCPPPVANISGPDTLCLFNDEPYFFTTTAQADATYNWSITNATIVDGQGTNTIEVMANVDLGPGTVSVTVTNQCGSASDTHTFEVIDCDFINPLPVELRSFTGKTSANGILLNWRTASEKNNDRFEVQRSVDGRNFESIGTVKGNGTSNTAHSYSFLDKNARTGINYYRLNQVDFDGSSARSQVIKVMAEGSAGALGVQVIPNPCLDQNCTVQLRNIDSSAPLTVELRDLTGRLIFSQQVPADQTSFQLPRVDSGSGIYILIATNGTHSAYQKIIIR